MPTSASEATRQRIRYQCGVHTPPSSSSVAATGKRGVYLAELAYSTGESKKKQAGGARAGASTQTYSDSELHQIETQRNERNNSSVTSELH